MRDVMIDLETMANSHDSTIIQFGGAWFDRHTGEIGKKTEFNVELQGEMEAGFQVNASTITWWMGQSQEAQKSVMSQDNMVDSITAVTMMNEFLRGSSAIWCHATFDMPIVSNHLATYPVIPSFGYWSCRDLRTLVDLAEIKVDKSKQTGVAHSALADCLFQIEYTVEAFQKIEGWKKAGKEADTKCPVCQGRGYSIAPDDVADKCEYCHGSGTK